MVKPSTPFKIIIPLDFLKNFCYDIVKRRRLLKFSNIIHIYDEQGFVYISNDDRVVIHTNSGITGSYMALYTKLIYMMMGGNHDYCKKKFFKISRYRTWEVR